MLNIVGRRLVYLSVGLIIAGWRPSAAYAQVTSAPPTPWAAQDIGNPTPSGSSEVNNDRFTIAAGGTSVSANTDQFRFVYQLLSDDVGITARVDSLAPAHMWSKAGLMIRASLQPEAPQGSVLMNGDGRVAFHSRKKDGGLPMQAAVDTSGTVPQWLGIERRGTRVLAYSSADGQTWAVVGSDSIDLGATVYVGIAVTSQDASQSTIAQISQVTVSGLPPGVSHRDIGGPAIAGSAWQTQGTYTVTSGGAAIPETEDQFHFVYQPIRGDLDVVARVASVMSVNRGAKAGVMIRESLAADSRHAFALLTAGTGSGYSFDRRVQTGGLSEHTDGGQSAPPGWVRLVRRGTTFEAFLSSDGLTWTPMGSTEIAMGDEVYVGLAVASQGARLEATAVLDHVSVGSVLGAVSAAPVPDQAKEASMAGVPALPQTAMLIAPPVAPPLGAAAAFGVLGNSAVTGAAGSGVIVSGDVGSSPTPAITGFPPSSTAAPFTIHTSNDSVVQQAHTDAIAAYNALLSQGPGTVISDDLGAVGALTSGIYSFTGGAPVVPAGATLTLNGPGVFVFNVATALTANVSSVVAGTANPCNIFWRVGTSATLNGVNFRGTVIANVSITLGAAANLEGRALAGTGATGVVTMAGAGGNTIGGCSGTVTPPNQPPTVTLTSPVNGATFTAPATVTMTASASDPENRLARVEFYRGSTLLGTDTAAPFSYTWSSVAAGSYTLTAVAADADGETTTSAAVSITVTAPNQAPTVSLTSPANGATFTAPASITLTASASDPENGMARVEFYQGSTLLNTDTASPYSYTWSSVAEGSYTLTAVAIDTDGGTTTSAVVSVTVQPPPPNQPPTVALTAPANGSTFTAPATITLTASASDPENRLTRVEFYRGSTLLAAGTAAPYSYTWSSVAAGSYTLTAVAADADGGTTTSAVVSITVQPPPPNQPPTVALTAPANGATFTAPATITLTASASDPENRLARVEFYRGSTLLATDTAAPFSYTWASVAAGSYTLTAVAADADGGTTTSAAVSITVQPAPNQPPTVALTSPADGATFTAPATITLTAAASDPENRLARVEFYRGTTLLATDTAPPYTFTWSSVAAGSYTLTAVATDADGGTTTSAAISIAVNTAPSTTRVVFTASIDHDTIVTSYLLEVFPSGADVNTASPVASTDLGKPTPNQNRDITVDETSFFNALSPGSYSVTVVAIAPEGRAKATPVSFTR